MSVRDSLPRAQRCRSSATDQPRASRDIFRLVVSFGREHAVAGRGAPAAASGRAIDVAAAAIFSLPRARSAKSPAFTVAATLALALGIGATTAMLSVVNGVLLRPLPYADSDRLVVILHQGRNPVAPANFLDWRAQTRSFTDVAAAEYWTPNLTGTDHPEQVNGLRLTAGMLPMLGVRPLLGRIFTEAEDTPGNEHVGRHQLRAVAAALRRRPRRDRPAGVARRPAHSPSSA